MSRSALPKLRLEAEVFELACGARLLVSPRSGAPVTAIEVHIRGGPSQDPPGLEGTAFLAGGLADQGTLEHDADEIAALLEPAGGEISGDGTGLHASIARGGWKRLVDLVCEMLTGATFPARRVRRQRERLLHRIAVEEDDPRVRAGRLFRRLVYGDHWLGRPAHGSRESVARIEPRHLRAHHRKNWVARRASIVVCGDVEAAKVRRRFDRRLANWRPGRDLKPRRPRFPTPARRVAVFPADREQVHVYLGHLGIERRHPDFPALVVMDHILGTGPGFTNRIARILRDELGLAYTVQASIHSSAGLLPGMFTAYIGTSPEHVRTAVDVFLREMSRIRDEPVSPEELEVAKSYLVGSFPLGFERASRRAGWFVTREVHGLEEDALEQLLSSLASTSAEDVQRVARAHLFPDRCCLAAAGPVTEKELRAALAEASERLSAGAGAKG